MSTANRGRSLGLLLWAAYLVVPTDAGGVIHGIPLGPIDAAALLTVGWLAWDGRRLSGAPILAALLAISMATRPFGVLLVRYVAHRQWERLALWAASYVLVSAFVVPTGLLSRLSGVDAWNWYIRGAWFLYGELLLMGLLLYEYLSVASRRDPIAGKRLWRQPFRVA